MAKKKKAENVVLEIDEVKFMETCLLDEKQALALMRSIGITTPEWEDKQLNRIAWMEQEIAKEKAAK